MKTPYEALTLASIIEKETGLATDRHLVSSVFNNRLSIGMPLQTDPTVIYGLGEKFSGNITRKDLQTPTPLTIRTSFRRFRPRRSPRPPGPRSRLRSIPPTPGSSTSSRRATARAISRRASPNTTAPSGSSSLNRPKTQKKAKPKELQPTKETAR